MAITVAVTFHTAVTRASTDVLSPGGCFAAPLHRGPRRAAMGRPLGGSLADKLLRVVILAPSPHGGAFSFQLGRGGDSNPIMLASASPTGPAIC
jgi:hypothetical protein